MLERHDSDCALQAQRDHEDEHEERQEDARVFSPRAHQEGFWS
jgi:hypothetical protein